MTGTQISLAETPDFDLGGVRVCPGRRQVGSNGKDLELEPKVALVLVALAGARPNVVSRDRLIDQCWDGRIVGDDALNRCIVALRRLANEFSPEPFEIQTVPRVGYSLIERPTAGDHAVVWTSWKKIISAALLLVMIAVVIGVAVPRFQRAQAAPASIAVLPFRNLSTGDPYFAEGIGEEILAQLAREPQFRVAGSTSSSQVGKDADVRGAARRLNVDYVVEGSVRRQGDHVRVNAGLLRANDGVRLWSESFDGKLDDVLKIQSAIGQAVASGLSRELIHVPRGAAPAVDGEAYALYLNARGLLRSQNPASGPDALRLLRELTRVAPTYAPGWSSLASALELDGRSKGNDGMVAVLPEARSAARRSLQLDPNLAEAHGIYAELVGMDSSEGIAHQWRAAALEPRSGQGLLWRSWALEASARWAEASVAMDRAYKADPLWSRTTRVMVDHTAIMGDRRGAEAAIKRGMADDPMLQEFALARVAWFSGDFSDAARRWSTLASGQSRWASPSKLSLENALFMLKLSKHPPSFPPRPMIGQARSTPAGVWMTAPPSAAEWQRRNRSSAAELVYRDENVIAAKLMLRAGRARELVATYDSPTGLLGVRHGQPLGSCYLQNSALVALTLRTVGRRDEADAMLRQADAIIQAAYRRGQVPLWFDDDAAGIWALQGKVALAANALNRALSRGSAHATRTDLPQLADEPALGGLRGNPAFEAVRAKYDAHFARERQEVAHALKIPLSA